MTSRKNPPANEQRPTFQSGVNLVLVAVIVRDKPDHAIGNLTERDFQIFDRGKRQSIVSFSVINHSQNPGELKPEPSRIDSAPAATRAETSSAVKPAANPQRSIVYLFDDFNVTFADLAAVRSAVSQHLRGLASTDRAAIYTFSGRPEIDFTSDRDKLQATVAKIRERTSSGHDDAKECPNVSVFLARLILERDDQNAHDALVQHTVSCAYIAATDPKVKIAMAEAIFLPAARRQLLVGEQQSAVALRTLRLAVKRLAEMPGERILILASPGFLAESSGTIADTQEILKLATQAGITINTLNSSGLFTSQAEASDDEQNANLRRQYQRQSAQANEGILRDFAKGTGGIFIHNDDGFRAAFDRMATPPEFSYLLGFSPTDSKPDGKFHPIKIRLASEKGLTVEARNGYYALQQDPAKQSARLEVDDALFSLAQRNELPVVLQTGYIKPNKGDPTVTVLVKVDLNSLRFRRANARNFDTLTVVSALFNQDGSYLAGTTQTVNLRLRSETLGRADPSVTLHFAFPVKPGAYVIRLVVRDAQSGAMSTFTRPEKIT